MSKFVVEKFQEEAYAIASCNAPEGKEEYWMHQYGRLTEPFDSREEAFLALEVWGYIKLLERTPIDPHLSTNLSGVIGYEVFDAIVNNTYLWDKDETIRFTIGPKEHPAQIRTLSESLSRLCEDENFTLIIGVEEGACFLDDKKQSLVYE